jgi:TupA-like ATPgrasp
METSGSPCADDVPAEAFSRRLARRHRLWWERPRLRNGRTLADAAHRLRERREFRRRDDPAEVWRCCAAWQRTLMNKWNGREFAAAHGCSVPALYWSGSDHARAPLDSLPSRFVIRPVFGTMRRGVAVVVDGRELLYGGRASQSGLRERLPRTPFLRRSAPILIEEFIGTPTSGDALPLECKCHTFGGHVEAVELLERTAAFESKHRYYTPTWEPIPDPIDTYLPEDEHVREPPGCLERMLDLAVALGAELGTYVRIDFFVAEGDCVFNEFSSVPLMGRKYTPYCDRVWGRVWAERLGDAV